MTRTREEWLAERKSGIGGSDVAAILGVSPWATAVDVWLDKTDRAEPKAETEAMRIGTELEDFVARRYCQETGRSVQRFNRTIHRGCLLGNFDRLVVPEGASIASHMGEVRTDTLLECKTSSRDWEGEVPIYYETQVQHYMGLADELRHADVAVLFLNHKRFEIHRVERDDEVIAVMRDRLTAWWDEYVVGDRMPPPVSEDDCRKLWARSNPGRTVTATEEIAGKVRSYAEARAEADAVKARLDDLRRDITVAMCDAEVLVDATGKPLVTWKSPSRDTARTDWEAVAKAAGASDDIIAANTVAVAGARRFLLKYKG